MKAVVFDGRKLSFVEDCDDSTQTENLQTEAPPSDTAIYSDNKSGPPEPRLVHGRAVIAPTLIGICRTDIELTRGYQQFAGIPGHEFVGKVVACEDISLIGQRVVGEINDACGQCEACLRGLGRHCPNRRVLGIHRLAGCMAERFSLPVTNLHLVPEDVPNDRAVFVEPLAAAFEILEQLIITEKDRCVVLGDGKLGILCAWTLATVASDITLVGRHSNKLSLARFGGIKTAERLEDISFAPDLVVEATGRPNGLAQAVELARPRGTIIIKSTIAPDATLDSSSADTNRGQRGFSNAQALSQAVVKEITLIGSRCGPFGRALKSLRAFQFPVERLIEARYPLSDAVAAFEHATRPGALKILLYP
ncbi:MAG: alcohol dehydrogenase catalytic domain-containing protein [Candidatus Riflebacteria bacterium]|nr:alcohol dehydrogenase catalytic domain-containing protein [Candidatus Riflebacteria bacterium]